LVAFYFLFLEQKANFSNFRLLQNIDTTVNVIDPQTNQAIATVPAKYIETSYLDASGRPNEGDIALLVLGNNGSTGYALLPVASLLPAAGQLPAEHQMIFDSFELVATNSTTVNATTIGPTPSSMFQQQLPQQRQQERQQLIPPPPPPLPPGAPPPPPP
jgi:hypothetical protein